MPAYSITVTGVVQGVFFRASTQEKAQSLRIQGWVRNQSDGSVLIHAEGEPEALQKFLDWCHQGPPQAKVDEVTTEEKSVKGFPDFSIRR